MDKGKADEKARPLISFGFSSFGGDKNETRILLNAPGRRNFVPSIRFHIPRPLCASIFSKFHLSTWIWGLPRTRGHEPSSIQSENFSALGNYAQDVLVSQKKNFTRERYGHAPQHMIALALPLPWQRFTFPRYPAGSGPASITIGQGLPDHSNIFVTV